MIRRSERVAVVRAMIRIHNDKPRDNLRDNRRPCRMTSLRLRPS